MRVRHFLAACLAGALVWTGLIVGAVHATATESNCVNPVWVNQTWYTWTGGPTEVAPDPDDPAWNTTHGDPQSPVHKFENHTPNVPYFVSHGGSGKGDWFLWKAVWRCADPLPSPTPTEPSPSATSTPEPSPTATPTSEPTPTTEPTSSPTPTVTPEPSPTPTEPPTVISTHTERTVDCELGVAIVITEWVYSDGTSRTLTEQEPLTETEKTECLPNSTPTSTPSTKPSETPSTTPTPSPSSTSVAPSPSSPGSPTSTPPSVPQNPVPPTHRTPHQPELAETGTDGVVWLFIALGLIGLGTTLYLTNRRKNNGY